MCATAADTSGQFLEGGAMTAVMTTDDSSNAWLSRLGTIDSRAAERASDQRDVQEAVMNSLCALATGEAAYAKRTSYLAASLDTDGTYSGLTSAVERGVGDIETAGEVQAGTWDRLAKIVGGTPLGSLVERIRTA
jgi:hypothetical protein